MTSRMQVYKCEVCGNIVEVVHEGRGELVCCGKPMKLMEPRMIDAALEKHVPVIEIDGDKVTVKIGSVSHPMTKEHYIEWIELVDEEYNRVQRKNLKPGDKPEAHFHVCEKCAEHVFAREYCNLHGLWQSKK